MPKIPEYNSQMSTILDKNPPGVSINPNNFAVAQEAAAKAAGQTADFALNLVQKRQEASDRNDAQQRVMQDTLDLNSYQQKLKTQMPDDYQGYTDAVKSWIKDRQQQNLDQAPTETAKNLYQQSVTPMFTHAVVGAQDMENKQRAQSYVTDISNSADDAGNALVNNPDLKLAYDVHHQLLDRINSNEGVTLTADQAGQLRAQAHEKIATAYFGGLYAKGLGDPKNGNAFLSQGIAALKGKTRLDQGAGDEALFMGLDPAKHAGLLDQFERALRTNQEISRSEISSQVRDYVSAASSGQAGNPQTLSNLSRAVSNGSMKPDEAARTMDSVAGAQAMGDIVKQMKGAPEARWDQLMNGFDRRMEQSRQSLAKQFPGVGALQGNDFNMAERSNFANKIQNAAADIRKARMKLAVESTYEAFPNIATQVQAAGNDPAKLKDALTAQFAAQESLGIQKKILTSDQEDLLVKSLKSGSPEQQSNQIDSLQKLYGDNFSKVVEELSGKNKVDPHLWAASYMPDTATRTQILDNMQSKTKIETGFKDLFNEAAGKQVDTSVKLRMAPFVAAWSGPGTDPAALDRSNAMVNAVTLQAKNIMATNGTQSPIEAVNQAMGIVTKNFTPIQAANSNILMPNLGNREPIVRGFMESTLSPEGLKDLNLKLPPTIKEEDAFSQIQKYGRWVNPSGNMLRLQIARPGETPIYLQNQNHQFIQFDMGDITHGNIPGPTGDSLYQRSLNQANKWGVQKLWERIR